jgi:hypothetical protein
LRKEINTIGIDATKGELDQKRNLQELDALFYLDSFDGKPLNMLNVCLWCSEH